MVHWCHYDNVSLYVSVSLDVASPKIFKFLEPASQCTVDKSFNMPIYYVCPQLLTILFFFLFKFFLKLYSFFVFILGECPSREGTCLWVLRLFCAWGIPGKSRLRQSVWYCPHPLSLQFIAIRKLHHHNIEGYLFFSIKSG